MKMKTFKHIEIFLIVLTVYFQYCKCVRDNEEITMTTPLLIQKHGYPSELHYTTTEDGYVLELHRIPYGKKSPPCKRAKKPVVLLMHGILASSSDFIINGPNISLGYLLADNNFDVWIGNIRGNRYSRNHITLNPSSSNFWDFSFNEVAIFDLPAIIDYILNKTGQTNLAYVGHSMGTTIYFILLSERPEYDSKIKAAFLLSPVVHLNDLKSPILKVLSFFTDPITLFLDIIGVGEFLPKFELLTQIGRMFCKADDFTQPICTHVLYILSGFSYKNLDTERLPIYMGHIPAGASTKTIMHYGQINQSGAFRKYNFGLVENLLKYKNIRPPLYKLNTGKAPIYLFCSKDDWFAATEDVNTLFNELPAGVAKKIEIQDPDFAHIDFTHGKNAKTMVYDNLIKLMKTH